MAKVKINGDRSAPCFGPFWMGNASDKRLPVQTLLWVAFKHILINVTSFVGLPTSLRILYKTSFLSESLAFLKSVNS